MNGLRGSLVLVALLGGLALARGEAPPAVREDLSRWAWYEKVTVPPRAAGNRRVDFLVPPALFAHARLDLGDLRLVDGSGQPIPYALRVRRDRDEEQQFPARAFNEGFNAATGVAELSLDLGEGPHEHNVIVVETRGTGYRRGFRLEGSDDGTRWVTMLDRAFLVRYATDAGLVEVKRLRYPPSRFRYLHLLVSKDRSLPDDEPAILAGQTRVLHAVKVAGEQVTQDARVDSREAEPATGGPGSSWLLDLGNLVPISRLELTIQDEAFSRPFTLETFDPGEVPEVVLTGELRREVQQGPVELQFPERLARRLRLRVTDYRNPPLSLMRVRHSAAARQVVFELPAGVEGPLRLFASNPEAQPPHYTFEQTLPDPIVPAPLRTAASELTANPDYHPLPLPWTERLPWLVDLCLVLACLVLLGVAVALVREAIKRHESAAPAPAG